MMETASVRVERILNQQDRFDSRETVENRLVDTPASVALKLGGVAMRFARIERVPRYDDGERESDVEHSFMLGLVATELATMIRPDLNIGLIHQYSSVHDLIELKTNDVLTFGLTPDELILKEQAEHDKLEELITELPPYTGHLLRDYEEQLDEESRFVRMVDKLMPAIVDTLGDGVRIMREDCGVSSTEQLIQEHLRLHARIGKKFEEFPELVQALRQLYDLFEVESAEAFASAA